MKAVQLIATDKELTMLSQIRANKINDGIELIACDMSKACFGNSAFDFVIFPQGSLQLLKSFSEVKSTLRMCRRLVKPKGTIMVDIGLFNPGIETDPHLRPGFYNPMLLDNRLEFDWKRKIQGNVTLSRWHKQKHFKNVLKTTLYYKVVDKGNHAKEYQMTMHSLRLTFNKLHEFTGHVGLRMVNVFSDYSGTAFRKADENKTSRLIAILLREK